MSQYRTIFFLLIFSQLFFSCSTTKGLKEHSSYREILIKNSSILNDEYESLLFKARIKIYKNDYTGLFLIKKIASDTSTHIVFLSEVGLNMLDLKYKNDEFELVSVKDFLNKPRLIKTIQNDFRMLVQDLDVIDYYTIKKSKSEASSVLKFKHKSQRYSYFYGPNSDLYEIWRKSGLFKTVATMGGEGKMLIEFSHRGIKLDINLEELERLNDYADN